MIEPEIVNKLKEYQTTKVTCHVLFLTCFICFIYLFIYSHFSIS